MAAKHGWCAFILLCHHSLSVSVLISIGLLLTIHPEKVAYKLTIPQAASSSPHMLLPALSPWQPVSATHNLYSLYIVYIFHVHLYYIRMLDPMHTKSVTCIPVYEVLMWSINNYYWDCVQIDGNFAVVYLFFFIFFVYFTHLALQPKVEAHEGQNDDKVINCVTWTSDLCSFTLWSLMARGHILHMQGGQWNSKNWVELVGHTYSCPHQHSHVCTHDACQCTLLHDALPPGLLFHWSFKCLPLHSILFNGFCIAQHFCMQSKHQSHYGRDDGEGSVTFCQLLFTLYDHCDEPATLWSLGHESSHRNDNSRQQEWVNLRYMMVSLGQQPCAESKLLMSTNDIDSHTDMLGKRYIAY